MNWPLPQDFNEAVQNPASAFNDPDLKAGQAVVGPTGLPLPRSGNFADVYQIRAADGRSWAVKCFTRPVTGLEQRYAKVDASLEKAGLPFTIGFTFLNEGVRVRGKWLPAVKMEWVDGLLLNQVVRDQAGNPKVLDALCQMWARLCKRLRDTGIAHADFQHGNVLLVPGSKPGSYGLKLIDYDGMYVPALANSPSGEAGHPNFQHPARAAKQVYSPDLDRFPHLVIATALKGLTVVGPSLWERYDSGDNLLFSEDDFRNPVASKLMRELWETKNPGLQTLVGHLAIACGKPVPQTPWLDQVAPDGIAVPLSLEQSRAAAAALDLAPTPAAAPVVAVVAPPAVVAEVMAAPPAPAGVDAFAGFDVEPEPAPAPRRKKPRPQPKAKKTSPALPIAIASGVLLLLGGVIGAVVLLGGKKPVETVQNEPETKKADDKEKSKRPPVKQIPGTADGGPKPPAPGPALPPKDPIIPPTPLPVGARGVAALNLDPAGAPELGLRWQTTARSPFTQVRFTTDGQWLIVRESNLPPIQVYAARSGTKSVGFTEGGAGTVDYVCLADGKVASWHADQPWAIIWNPENGKAVGKIPVVPVPGDRGSRVFDASPDGRYAIVGYVPRNGPMDGGPVGQVSVYDTRPPGRTVATLDVRAPRFRFTPDGWLLVADADRFRWLKLPEGTIDRELPLAGDPRGRVLACSKDGTLALLPDRTREPKLFDPATGKVIASFPRRFLAMAGAVSDDNRLVALCAFPEQNAPDRSSHLEVIDLTTGRLLGRFRLHPNSNIDVQSVAFAPDNSAVAIGRSGRLVQVIELPKELLAAAPKPKDPGPMNPPPVPGAGLPPTTLLKPRWTAPTDTGDNESVRPQFTGDGQTVIVPTSARRTIQTFDANTGKPGPTVPNRNGIYWVIPVGPNRVASSGFDGIQITWDAKTGLPVEPALKFPELPPLPPGRNGHAGVFHAASTSGRYTLIARREAGAPPIAGPIRAMDTTTGKELLKLEWTNGGFWFTRDESKLLVLADGKASWYKLPTGELDGSWNVGSERDPGRVFGMSPGGGVILYFGPVPGLGSGTYLLEGKTGRVIRRVNGLPYQAHGCTLSPDGRYAAMLLVDFNGKGASYNDIFEVAGWKLVGRVMIREPGMGQMANLAFSSDGRTFAVHYPDRKELAVYDLPGGAIAVVPPKPKDLTPPAPPFPNPAARKPVPDDAAVAKAGMKLRDDLKSDYAQKLPAEKRVFAQKLLGLAETADDPAARYVMLRDASDLAIEVSDPPLMMQAVDGLLRWYDLDRDRVKLPALDKLKYKVGNTTALRAVVDFALVAGDTAAATDRHETAVKYAQLAVTAARRANIPAVIEETDGELTRAKKAAEMFVPVKAALDQLRTNPDDREAALLAGKYRCFTQGRWEEGVKLLAGGGAGGLKAAAELDAATPRTGMPDTKAADAWWEFSRSAPEPEKSAAESRARYWYARALPGLPADRRADVEKRLALSVNGVEYRPGLLAEFTAKVPTILQGRKARIEPGVMFTGDEFKAEGIGKATDVTVKWSGVITAPRPGRYKLVTLATDRVLVRLDGKLVIDTTGSKVNRREAIVVLPDRPTLIAVEFTCLNTDKHNLKLCWVAPGGEAEELVPPDALFHDRKAEGAVGKAP